MDVSPERYAPHLSEFYSMMNGSDKTSGHIHKASPQVDHPKDFSAHPMDDVVSTSTSTQNNLRRPSSIRSGVSGFSITELHALVTKEDIKKTQGSMKSLVGKITKYSEKLNELAQFSTEIAFELEDMARLKGCSDLTADKFINASGLFHLVSNHDRIISNCCEEVVVKGLNQKVEKLDSDFKAQEITFKKQFKDQSIKLKLQERYSSAMAKRKIRNLVSYRENLTILQHQLDQLEMLKHDYYQKSYGMVEATCQGVLKDIATLARAQIEISENIARKGWSGGGLDNLIIDADDPFSTGNEDEADINLTHLAQIPENASLDNSKSNMLTPKKQITPPSNDNLLNQSDELLSSPAQISNSEGNANNNIIDEKGNTNSNMKSHPHDSSHSNETENENAITQYPETQSITSVKIDKNKGDFEEDNFDNSFSLPPTNTSNNKGISSSSINDFPLSADNILEATGELNINDQSSTFSN